MTKEPKGLSRRSFVAASGAAVAGAAANPSVSFASFGPQLEAAKLAEFIGTTFKASGEAGTARVQAGEGGASRQTASDARRCALAGFRGGVQGRARGDALCRRHLQDAAR